MSKAAARRVTRLARAVDEGHFQLYAQAIVPLRPAVRPALPAPRYEILLRLPDGKGRVQAAAEFLPRAERASLMPAIDRWVVREAIALLGQWQRDYPDSELPGCSINLSPSALTDGRLIPLLEQQLARHGVPARTLCFEFAERAALANLAGTLDFIAGLRSAGCGVALDDVGGGVTSLTYLKTLSVDFLKIGGPLVHAVVADPVSASIVGSVNQIGLSMGAFTIAKEVGSTEVLDKLRALGIGYAQGNAVAAPVPLADLNGRLLVPPAGDGR
jgi:EAL domain-containing protein (putative c-di-GMP-specific phosphodiesterase class I)